MTHYQTWIHHSVCVIQQHIFLALQHCVHSEACLHEFPPHIVMGLLIWLVQILPPIVIVLSQLLLAAELLSLVLKMVQHDMMTHEGFSLLTHLVGRNIFTQGWKIDLAKNCGISDAERIDRSCWLPTQCTSVSLLQFDVLCCICCPVAHETELGMQ